MVPRPSGNSCVDAVISRPLRLLRRSVLLATGAALLAGNGPPVPSSISWSEPIEIAAGGGTRGPWQQNDSRFQYVDDPVVAIDLDGNVAVAWVDQSRRDVFFHRVAADGKKRLGPVNVSRTPAVFSWLPRLAIDGRNPDRIHVLWQEIVFSGGSHGGDIFVARSRDGGATFGPPVNLSRSVGGDGKGRMSATVWHNGSHDLALGADGTLYAVWTEYDGALWFTRSDDGGVTYARPRQIGGARARPARAPALAVSGTGRVFVAWTIGENAGADVHVATSADRGRTFTAPVVAARTPGYSDAPKVAVDGKGTVHLVHAESVGGPFTPAAIHYTRSDDDGRTFAPSQELSAPPGQGVAGAGYPALAIDGTDAVHVCWEVDRPEPPSPRGLGYTMSRDRGRTFQPPVIIPGSVDPGGVNGSLQGRLMKKLAVSRAGHVAIVNSSFREGEASRVWLIRGRPSAPNGLPRAATEAPPPR